MLFPDFRLGQRMLQQPGQAVPRSQLVQLPGPIASDSGRLQQDPVRHGLGEKIIATLGQGIKLEFTILLGGQENDVQPHPLGIKPEHSCQGSTVKVSHLDIHQNDVRPKL